jgi:hypothetical protein
MENNLKTKSQMTLRGYANGYHHKVLPVCNDMFVVVSYKNDKNITTEVVDTSELRVIISGFETNLPPEEVERFIKRTTTHYNEDGVAVTDHFTV